MIQPYIS
jgi:chloramphenicol 3-O-phosphotransferase